MYLYGASILDYFLCSQPFSDSSNDQKIHSSSRRQIAWQGPMAGGCMSLSQKLTNSIIGSLQITTFIFYLSSFEVPKLARGKNPVSKGTYLIQSSSQATGLFLKTKKNRVIQEVHKLSRRHGFRSRVNHSVTLDKSLNLSQHTRSWL